MQRRPRPARWGAGGRKPAAVGRRRPTAGRWSALARRRLSRSQGDSGFALLEVAIALVILLVILTGLAVDLAVQLGSVSASRDEGAALSLLAKALGEVDAMPFTDVAKGLKATDSTTGTSHIVKVSATTWKFTDSTASGKGSGEKMPHSGTLTSLAPLIPHSKTTRVDTETYTVAAYPTYYLTTSTTKAYRVTVVISWTLPNTAVPTHLVGQTIVFSSGSYCNGGTTNPFAAPCEPNFDAYATAGGGYVTLSPASTSTKAVAGLTVSALRLALPGAHAEEELVQSSHIESTSRSGGYLVLKSGSTTVGLTSITAATTTDPTAPVHVAQKKTLTSATEKVTITTSGTQNSITANTTSGDTGRSVATPKAATGNTCVNTAGTAIINSLPCGSAYAYQSKALSLSTKLYAGSTALGTVPIVSVAAQASATKEDKAFTGRFAGTGANTCTSGQTTGCVEAQAKMSLGTVTISGLPSKVLTDAKEPTGWQGTTAHNYLIKLTGFAANATSWSKSVATHYSHTSSITTSPKVSYYTATSHGYKNTIALATLPTTFAVTATDTTIAGGAVTVQITASLSPAGASTNPSSTTTSHCVAACKSYGRAPSAISGTLTYVVKQGATVIANFKITLTLGTATSSTSYQEAS